MACLRYAVSPGRPDIAKRTTDNRFLGRFALLHLGECSGITIEFSEVFLEVKKLGAGNRVTTAILFVSSVEPFVAFMPSINNPRASRGSPILEIKSHQDSECRVFDPCTLRQTKGKAQCHL